MAEINAACTILRDPDKRVAWDQAHLRVPGTVVRSPAAPGQGSDSSVPGGPPDGPVAWRRGPFGEGGAGPPPGPRRGSVLPFGRHIGWSLGEIARVDPGYLAWLRDRREGTPWRAEITALLDGMRRPGDPAAAPARRRRGLFG